MTADVQLRWFQARLLHRLLPTNKFIFHCKIVDDPLCSFCNQEIETIRHLLWNCYVVKAFWEGLNSLLIANCAHCQNILFSEELVLFGTKNGIETDITLELIILMAKFYIYIIIILFF